MPMKFEINSNRCYLEVEFGQFMTINCSFLMGPYRKHDMNYFRFPLAFMQISVAYDHPPVSSSTRNRQ